MADDEILNDETCRAIAEGKLVPQNSIALRPYQQEALNTLKEGWEKNGPPVLVVDPPARRVSLGYRPHQVLAIAAALVASSPGMFGGPDILPPIDVERYRETLKKASSSSRRPPIVLDSVRSPEPEQPPVNEPNRYRNPASSKLARKAARGKL